MENREQNSSVVRWKILFSGRVQFVGFRYTACFIAKSLKVTGWVENLDDGSVIMEAQGRRSDVRRLILKLKSHPPIRIEHMDIREIPVEPKEKYFSVMEY